MATRTGADRRLASPPAGATVLGLDEAGRGSVLGPLVVGGFLVAEARIDALRELGVRDSKLLTPARRELIYAGLESIGQRVSIALPPAEIDRSVAHHGLNDLEAEAFARLVRRTRPSFVRVDACDTNAARFGATIRRLAEHDGPVWSAHGADRTDLVVGAGSIVAKVRRDRAVATLERRLGRKIGSGYPSDPMTVDIVRSAVAEGDRPSWLRASWKTVTRVKPTPPLVRLESFP
ncbi:MAG: ribonuclease HII [Thermoplasmata archaeon]|nr:ribonuclease HII [Thermoplasmata archaeon]